ncbi:MAG: MFS transporter [Chromatiaceae bacterium]|nr:MFS transporter [Chromatiaceae bacterium]
MTSAERRASAGLAGIFALRMLGLFLILPVFAIQAREVPGATPLLIGIAIGAYGLTQALLQIPFGMLSDRIGRKPVILGGLILFVIGSVVAALADDIYGVIIGRLLQGSGAIAAAIMALTADLTREAVRTRAMAGIGISIALSFALALVLGPIVAHWGGLEGLFWFIAVLACAGILILLLVVPNPIRSSLHRDAEPVASQFRGVLAHGELRRLDLGIFTLHLTMTSLFLVLPLFMRDQGLAPVDHWLVYLPVLLLSILAMVPLIIQAEGKGRMKLVFLGTLAALVLGLLGLNYLGHGILAIAFWLFVLITIFNLLEAVLPSMVSKVAPAGAKGTAMGVYSTSQFAGAFLGGVVGGWIHQHLGPEAVPIFCALAVSVWLLVAWGMQSPRQGTPHMVRVGDRAADPELRNQLLAIPGVEEALIVAEEGVAYLKVDKRQVDWARLQEFAAEG